MSKTLKKTLKILLAFLIGVFALLLFFVLGEGIRIPSHIPGAENIHRSIVIVVLGAYFFIAEYLLSRRNPQALRTDWPLILALNLMLIISAGIAFAIEPNRVAVMEAVVTAVLTVAFSCAGAALAGRAARH